MTLDVPTVYRLRRGLTPRQLQAFSYRDLKNVTWFWVTRDGGRQSTFRYWEDRFRGAA